jgi:DNA-binding Lrp family transcriptional regulator
MANIASLRSNAAMVTLDRFDRQLLNLVQADASQTAEALAASVSLSVSAIQRRLRQLREAGVITRHIAVVDPQRIEKNTTFVVSLQLEKERPELMAPLRQWLAQQPHVQQAYYVTGEFDFVLIITAPDVDTYDTLMASLLQANPSIKRFTTNVALNVVKRGLAIPLALEE